jgi:8-oxo-dGTP pyrophosphatase MutT (NUDIX family)
LASDLDFAPHLTVAAVVERDGRFLCVEEHVGGARVINQPAGHVDDGESLLDAVRRETLEETGWQFEPEALVAIYRWRHPDNGETFIRATFRGELGQRLHDRPPDDSIIEAVWLTRDELCGGQRTLRSPLVVRSVEDYLAGNRFPLDLLVDL